MQRFAVRIVNQDPRLSLARPIRQRDLLLRSMPDLDRGAVFQGGSHIAECRIAHEVALPYRNAIIPD